MPFLLNPPNDPGDYIGDPDGIAAYVNSRTDATENFILQLGTLAASMTPTVITPVFPNPSSAPLPITVSPPTLTDVAWVSPDAPDAFVGSLDVSGLMPEPFDEDPPALNFPSAPVPFSEAAPSAPGVNVTYADPGLTVDLPAPPSLLSLSVTPFSGVTAPDAIDTTIPALTAVAPDVVPYAPGSGYQSNLLDALRTSRLDWYPDGFDTGLPADVETALWDRGREREYRQKQDNLDQLDRMSELGYSFPPGAYLDARLKVELESDYTIAGISREIMIKQADLHLKNIELSMQTATTLEQALISYNNQVEQRLFDATKYATEAGIAIYNAKVQAYSAYVDAYKTKVAIYEAQWRGEVAKVEAYRAEIAAEEAKAQVNSALIAQYKVQVDAALSAITVYEARLNGIRTKAEIEKLKVEIFGEQVRGYVAKINAYTAGVEGFRASVQAEGAKQEAYQSKVSAYTATVDAGSKQIMARIEEFKGLLAAKTEEWAAFTAAYQGEAARAQATTAFNQSLTLSYEATVRGTSAYNEVLTRQWQAALDQAQRVSEIGIKAAEANAQLYLSTRSIAIDAAKVGAQVNAQLGASALNAIHWSTSYNSSWSTANSWSNSNAQSESTNTNYNYSA